MLLQFVESDAEKDYVVGSVKAKLSYYVQFFHLPLDWEFHGASFFKLSCLKTKPNSCFELCNTVVCPSELSVQNCRKYCSVHT